MLYSLLIAFLLASLLTLTSSTNKLWADFPSSLDTFSVRFFKEAANQKANKNKNVVTSALSADVVMMMIALGAEHETMNEITDALAVESVTSVANSLKKTLTGLENVQGVDLKLANKIYVRHITGKIDSVAPAYREFVQNIFKSDIQNIDFAKNIDAAKEINEWVETKTNHRIKNLIDAFSLSSLTAAVLVNAIYFKGNWEKVFDIADTKREDFYLADGSTTQVDMMYQRAHFLYKESDELDAKIVVLPYSNSVMSMVVILPNKMNGIEEIEDKLAASGTHRYLKRLFESEIDLKLPRFTIGSTIDVKEVFQKLGATRVFDPSLSQLRGILSIPTQLFVSEAIQKAFIEVNEKGSEAAAATFAETEDRIAGGPVLFSANHAFLVQIVTGEAIEVDYGCYNCGDVNGDVIFTAKIINPNSRSDS